MYKKLLVLASTKLVACLPASDFPSENPRPQTRNFPYTKTLAVILGDPPRQKMNKLFDIEKSKNQRLTKTDFVIGTIIACMLLTIWIIGSSGMSLIATFVPGLVFAWLLFAFLYFKQIELPDYNVFLPLYFLTLGWQFIHFTEEFMTNFKEFFPLAYGGQSYSNNTFVAFNMCSYFVFIVTPVTVAQPSISKNNLQKHKN